ncbi:MAG TPA: 16S rRNA (cytidine(1402)-2'-O)-methyltransferase [Pseudomonadales bacterium]
MTGTLYVVATPIGNLQDFSRRGADVLGSVAMIAAEDTRRTRVLLEAIGVRGVRIEALHAHNEAAASDGVLARLQDGDSVALVSDAGTPLLSDPGFELVRACWQAGIPVRPVPGPSALAAVLSVCPLPAHRFLFDGFLPAKAAARASRLRELLALGVAVVFFEAPHRMAATLEELQRLAPERRLMIGREMTKRHEQYLCERPAALLESLTAGDHLKGEFVCVLEGAEVGAAPADARRTLEVLLTELPPAQAARIAAQLLGLGRRELYDLAITLRAP